MADTIYDVAIVGSGPSGGRIACDLTAAGLNCVMLEAGREYGPDTFPENERDYSTQMFWGGGLELSSDANLGLLRARCLGGTSIVNQALLDPFDEVAWGDWRDVSGFDFLREREMQRHYDACASAISISEIPREFWNRNTAVFTSSFERHGYQWKALERGQKDCALDKGSDCIVCLGGCRRESKQSSLVTTIRQAREQGLEVRCQWEAQQIEYAPDQVRVIGTVGATAAGGGRQETVRARRLVLAAGSLGNSGILLRSQIAAKLPALGSRFTCHPQYMTYAVYDQEIDAHKGAFQAVKSYDPKLRAMGVKLENVYAPPVGTAMLLPGIGANHMRMMRKFRYMASMEVALRDEATGQIRLDKKGAVVVDKKLTKGDRATMRRGLKLVRDLFESESPREVIQCTDGFGLHLMGGCPLGSDAASSVVAEDFTVHGHPNITIADSSVFPSAPGINPSFTVMALAHRAAEQMLATGA